jgi:hypothetical protein
MATIFAVGTWLSFLDDDKQTQLYSEFKAATGKSVRTNVLAFIDFAVATAGNDKVKAIWAAERPQFAGAADVRSTSPTETIVINHAETWQSRAIEATRGHLLGSIIDRIVGGETTGAPAFNPATRAHVTPAGHLIADFQVKPDRPFTATRVGLVSEITSALSKLADKLQLTDADREAMLLAMRNWIDDREPQKT